MIKRLWLRWFGQADRSIRAPLVPVEIPERYGSRPDLSEIKTALLKRADDPAVRAMVHLMLMSRTVGSVRSRAAARQGQSTTFDLGGVDYLDALFNSVDALVQGEDPDDLVKEWFTQNT